MMMRPRREGQPPQLSQCEEQHQQQPKQRRSRFGFVFLNRTCCRRCRRCSTTIASSGCFLFVVVVVVVVVFTALLLGAALPHSSSVALLQLEDAFRSTSTATLLRKTISSQNNVSHPNSVPVSPPFKLMEQLEREQRQQQQLLLLRQHKQPSNNISDGNKNNTKPYAYVFVVSRCGGSRGKDKNNDDDDESNSYRSYLYGVYVAVYSLRKLGSSKADFVLFYRMSSSPSSSYGDEDEDDDLPPDEKLALRKLGILAVKLPNRKESYYNIQMTKFRALALVQYRRVMYLDSDVLPLSNLDALFEASDPDADDNTIVASAKGKEQQQGQQQQVHETLVLRGGHEPALGCLFMVSPRPGDLERVDALIRKKEQQLDKFDPKIGWNIESETNDDTGIDQFEWEGKNGLVGKDWNFIAASGDQGLLWYWATFVVNHVSVMDFGKIHNYQFSSTSKQKLKLERTVNNPIPKYRHSYPDYDSRYFVHFHGKFKGPSTLGCDLSMMFMADEKRGEEGKPVDPLDHWCRTLKSLSDEHQLGIDMKGIEQHPAAANKARKLDQEQGSFTSLVDW